MLIEDIDGMPPAAHPMAPFLVEAGFLAGALGFQAQAAIAGQRFTMNRRPAKSVASSPFARRYFEATEEEG